MTLPLDLPHEFVGNAARTWGDRGRRWIAGLPALVEDLCARWGLSLATADFTLSYNFVAPVNRQDGTPAVLKLGPVTRDLLAELNALAIYAGQGMCRLIEHDAARGAMLLERVQPGVPLLDTGETPESVSAAVGVMRRLRRAPSPSAPLPSLLDLWRTARDGLRQRTGTLSGPFPPAFVDEATEIYEHLFADPNGHVVLHGDLHHWNILSSDRDGWLAIDPHGVTGPPECEVGAFMLNPNDGRLARLDVTRVLARRLDQFADELAFDRETLRLASFAYCMLSITWSAEGDGDRWKPGLQLAHALRQV